MAIMLNPGENTNAVEVIPDYTDAIVAVRAFVVFHPTASENDVPLYMQMRRTTELRAVSVSTPGSVWQVGPNKAECRYGDHAVPDPSCGCGFYALSDAVQLESQYVHRIYDHAVVKMWGRVIPGSQGWRAEYAEIDAFLLTQKSEKRRLRRLARTYGVPLLSRLPELTPPMVEDPDPQPYTHVFPTTVTPWNFTVRWTTTTNPEETS